MACLLPGALSDFFGLECPLGDHRAVADFLVCCRARYGSLEKLATGTVADRLPSVLQQNWTWRHIQAMAREWLNPDSVLRDAVHNLWFEFDVSRAQSPSFVPNVFIGSYRLCPPASPCDPHDIGAACTWLTDMALPTLAGRPIAPAVRRQIARCLNTLPAGASLFQVGLMLARDATATRLCARGLTSPQIVAYLNRVGWPGTLRSLTEFLESLHPVVERIDLDLDVDEDVSPKIGLECYLGTATTRINKFVECLVSEKLCTGPKAGAIASWPGTVPDRPPRSAEPEASPSPAAEMEAPSRAAFVRRLHHVKLDFQAAAPLRAKAYLGVHHKPGNG